jgi:hypothetical protein
MLALAAMPAGAQTCYFDTECFESEACQPAAFEVMTKGAPVTGLSTEFGELPVVFNAEGLTLAQGAGIAMLLDHGADGTARASVHMKGPTVVTYLGRCETPPPAKVLPQPGEAPAAVPAEEK